MAALMALVGSEVSPTSLQCFTAPPLQGGQGGVSPPWMFGDESLPPWIPPLGSARIS